MLSGLLFEVRSRNDQALEPRWSTLELGQSTPQQLLFRTPSRVYCGPGSLEPLAHACRHR